jgi:transposase-like protein
MNTRTTIASLSREIATESDAYRHLEGLRWGDTPVCAHCDGTDVYLIPPANGVSRKTAGGTMSERRVWKCRSCKKQFSVLTGTMMHATKIPVRTWVLVIFDMIAAKNGISAREVERKYGVCPRSAWHMLHRIREAMASPYALMFQGVVMADEAYIGGDPKNRHAWQRVERDGRGTDKTPVVTIVDQDTGEVRSHVVTGLDQWKLGQLIVGNVDPTGSVLVTDGFKGYNLAASFFPKHEVVDHSAGQYVINGYSTNRVESFFSQLKRSIDGTHHHVSVKHLHRYVAEHDFRRSTCKVSDTERMSVLVGQMEGRLPYEELVAE